MTIDFSADLDNAFLTDFGVDVTLADTTVKGIPDDMDQMSEDAAGNLQLTGTRRSVLVKTGALDVSRGDTIMVDGVDYLARDSRREPPDGLLTRIILAEPTA